VLRAILGFGIVSALSGIAAGVFGAQVLLAIGRTMVYELPVLGPPLAALVSAGLVIVVAATVLPHALRSARVNPILVLRD
jgi:ABC-type antimicrobial peptide transport system permease subunit